MRLVCPRFGSYVAAECGPLVQRLGMDEIFADITEQIRGRGTAETLDDCGDMANDAPQLLGQWNADRSAMGFTGHVYAPGGGGLLLEAQTGLEISLASTTNDGDSEHVCEVAENLSRGHATSMKGESPTPYPYAPEESATVTSAVPTQSSLPQQGENIAAQPNPISIARRCGKRVGECWCGCIERLAKASAFAERVRQGLRDEVNSVR